MAYKILLYSPFFLPNQQTSELSGCQFFVYASNDVGNSRPSLPFNGHEMMHENVGLLAIDTAAVTHPNGSISIYWRGEAKPDSVVWCYSDLHCRVRPFSMGNMQKVVCGRSVSVITIDHEATRGLTGNRFFSIQ